MICLGLWCDVTHCWFLPFHRSTADPDVPIAVRRQRADVRSGPAALLLRRSGSGRSRSSGAASFDDRLVGGFPQYLLYAEYCKSNLYICLLFLEYIQMFHLSCDRSRALAIYIFYQVLSDRNVPVADRVLRVSDAVAVAALSGHGHGRIGNGQGIAGRLRSSGPGAADGRHRSDANAVRMLCHQQQHQL